MRLRVWNRKGPSHSFDASTDQTFADLAPVGPGLSMLEYQRKLLVVTAGRHVTARAAVEVNIRGLAVARHLVAGGHAALRTR